MVKFISENWANILLIIVGSFALATYILQERKKKIDAASLIVLQIDEFQERLREISTFIVDGQLNETAFYESLPLIWIRIIGTSTNITLSEKWTRPAIQH